MTTSQRLARLLDSQAALAEPSTSKKDAGGAATQGGATATIQAPTLIIPGVSSLKLALFGTVLFLAVVLIAGLISYVGFSKGWGSHGGPASAASTVTIPAPADTTETPSGRKEGPVASRALEVAPESEEFRGQGAREGDQDLRDDRKPAQLASANKKAAPVRTPPPPPRPQKSRDPRQRHLRFSEEAESGAEKQGASPPAFKNSIQNPATLAMNAHASAQAAAEPTANPAPSVALVQPQPGAAQPNKASPKEPLNTAEKLPIYQSPVAINTRRVQGSDPEFPSNARAAHLEATLWVKIFVTPDGTVGSFQFVKGHPTFEPAVEKALRTWRFSPFKLNGIAIATYTMYKFVFTLG